MPLQPVEKDQRNAPTGHGMLRRYIAISSESSKIAESLEDYRTVETTPTILTLRLMLLRQKLAKQKILLIAVPPLFTKRQI